MPHRHSVDFDQIRPQSGSNLQNYYANQRQQPRQSEAEQMMQAKRRMAAQRERELRNYHQEQQYNRSRSRDLLRSHDSTNHTSDVNVQGRSDRAISPNTMNEEDRRELIARQHRALYGNEAPFYDEDTNTPRPSNPASGPASSSGGRGASPRTYDPFAMGQGQPSGNLDETSQLNFKEQNQSGGKGPSPKPQQGSSHENSTASPASNPTSQTFSIFESAAQQSSRTSTSSPGGSPPRQMKTATSGVAPIGTRPAQANNSAINNKRSGTPSQSPLSHGFSANNDSLNPRGVGNERSTSSASNPSSGVAKDSTSSTWGTGSGVWGNASNNKSVGAVWG